MVVNFDMSNRGFLFIMSEIFSKMVRMVNFSFVIWMKLVIGVCFDRVDVLYIFFIVFSRVNIFSKLLYSM